MVDLTVNPPAARGQPIAVLVADQAAADAIVHEIEVRAIRRDRPEGIGRQELPLFEVRRAAPRALRGFPADVVEQDRAGGRGRRACEAAVGCPVTARGDTPIGCTRAGCLKRAAKLARVPRAASGPGAQIPFAAATSWLQVLVSENS
jgi:hypothetical protein